MPRRAEPECFSSDQEQGHDVENFLEPIRVLVDHDEEPLENAHHFLPDLREALCLQGPVKIVKIDVQKIKIRSQGCKEGTWLLHNI